MPMNRSIRFPSEWLPEDQMIHLKNYDICFITRGGLTDAEIRNSYYTLITWPDGKIATTRMVFQTTGIQYRDPIENSVGGDFGPVFVKFKYTENYQGGDPFWLVEFCANNILARRTALMKPDEFEKATAGVFKWQPVNPFLHNM